MKQQRIVTECPACKSRFQVTEGQLKIAHGKVRCGSCLEVFSAELCQIPELAPQPQQEPRPAERQPEPNPVPPAPSAQPYISRQTSTREDSWQNEIDLDLPVHALFDSKSDVTEAPAPQKQPVAQPPRAEAKRPARPARPAQASASQTERQASKPRQITPSEQLPPQQAVSPTNTGSASENGQLNFSAVQRAQLQQSQQHQEAKQDTSDQVLTAQPDYTDDQAEEVDSPTSGYPASAPRPSEESESARRIRKALAEHHGSHQERNHDYLNPAEKKLQELLQRSNKPLTATQELPADIAADSVDSGFATASLAEDNSHISIADLHVDGSDKSITADLQSMETEPVMIRATTKPANHFMALSFVMLLALAALALQYLWFERNRLIQQPALADLYQPICSRIDCRLSVPQSISSIITEQLIVQEHKEFESVLQVSMLLQNQAPFGQPFPALELAFSNRQGDIVNRRTLQPEEYLNTQAFNPASMPLANSVQIHFDILDPGRAAVGYQIRLKPARSHEGGLKLPL